MQNRHGRITLFISIHTPRVFSTENMSTQSNETKFTDQLKETSLYISWNLEIMRISESDRSKNHKKKILHRLTK